MDSLFSAITLAESLAMESRARLSSPYIQPVLNHIKGPFAQLTSSIERVFKSIAFRLQHLARSLFLAFQLTVNISFNAAIGACDLGIMSPLPGHRKVLNTLRGKSNTQSQDDYNSDIKGNRGTEFDDGRYWHNNTVDVMYDRDTNMVTPTEGRVKAKDEAELQSLHALLEQGTNVPGDPIPPPASLIDWESVMQEVQPRGERFIFVPDGERTRYVKPSARKAAPNNGSNSMCPQPLQLGSARRVMAASEEPQESMTEFLKTSEPLAILQEQQKIAATVQSTVAPATENAKPVSDASLLGPLRRKISSTFIKDSPEKSRLAEGSSPSPSHSLATYFRKPSSTKSTPRSGDNLQSIAETDVTPADRLNISSGAIDPTEEQSAVGSTYNIDNAAAMASPTPASKATTYKPLIAVSTTQKQANSSPSLSQSSTLKNVSSSRNRKGSRQASPSFMISPSIFSPTPIKPKRPKFKDSDTVIKSIERKILQAEFGVNTTSQLTSAYVKRPRDSKKATSYRGHNNSLESTTNIVVGSRRNRLPSDLSSNLGTQSFPPFLPHTRQDSNITTGSSVEDRREYTDSFISAANTFESQGSTVHSSPPRASGDTSRFTTTPSTPDTPNTGGPLRIRRKEVGAGLSPGLVDSTTDSPTNSLGRFSGNTRAESFGEHTSSIYQSSPRLDIGRSFTEPYSGQAAIGSIQPSTSLQEDTTTDVIPRLVPRPLRCAGRSPLNTPFDDSNISPYTGSYQLKVLPTRGLNPDSPTVSSSLTSQTRGLRIDTSGFSSACLDDADIGIDTGDPYMVQASLVNAPAAASTPSPAYQNVSVHDFQDPYSAGAPSNRLRHEENAEEMRRQKKTSKENYVAYKVQSLRRKTNTEIIQYNRHDEYPRNPNHQRRFHSKNLWCSQCTSVCSVCQAPCCALKGAALTVLSKRATPMQKIEAIMLQKDIASWLPTGVDNPTFMDCTDCHKLVCPECTSICPVEPCCDRLCRDCNTDHFWLPCEYHTPDDIEFSGRRAQERLTDPEDMF